MIWIVGLCVAQVAPTFRLSTVASTLRRKGVSEDEDDDTERQQRLGHCGRGKGGVAEKNEKSRAAYRAAVVSF